ncbi:uncharacterized protein LOC133184253 [Saccostrea echinata]|uniref:uncharacterized protein LOC133184253 n=1 Tax=Saccostrea echinata TaxID=191078 RepID=UPI002A7F604A|nr:uncharacterized protein LOC133184253 [Saccostrea echinata]
MKIVCRLLQFSHLSFRFKTYNTLNLHARDRLRYGLQCYNRVPIICYSNLSDHDVKKRTEELTDCFMEARELMQDAQESMNTVYFSEDMQEASKAVAETIKLYEKFLKELNENQKKEVTRTIGLKMAELRAQYSAMEEELKAD